MKSSYFLAATLLVATSNPASSQKKPVPASSRKIDLDLIEAIRVNDAAKVVALLNRGANAKALNGRPLDWALQGRRVTIARELMKRGARPTFDQLIYSITQWSATPKEKRVTELMLDNGLDVNQMTKWKWPQNWFSDEDNNLTTPLIMAVRFHSSGSKDTELLKILIKRGAKVDLALPDGKTALDIAAENDRFDVAVLLLNNGASIAKSKNLLFKRAMITGNGPMLTALKERGLIPAGLTFNQFEFNSSAETIKAILDSGADPNEKQKEDFWKDWTILHMAVRNGDLQGVRYLLDAGAKVDPLADYWHDEQKQEGLKRATPAFFAVEDIPKLQLLLARGANPNAVETQSGFSLLMWAAIFGDQNTKAIAALLKAGANINLTDLQKQTVLHLAATNDKTESVKALLAANHNKAFVEARDQNGQTALMRAIAPLSIKRDNPARELYPSKNYVAYIPTVDALVKAGANIKTTDDKGNTVLHQAASANSEFSFAKIGYFMQRGNKLLDVQNKNGETPFYLACKNNDIEGALFLFERGANPDTQTKNGSSPRKVLTERVHTPREQTGTKEEKDYYEMFYAAMDKQANEKRQYIQAVMNGKAKSFWRK